VTGLVEIFYPDGRDNMSFRTDEFMVISREGWYHFRNADTKEVVEIQGQLFILHNEEQLQWRPLPFPTKEYEVQLLNRWGEPLRSLEDVVETQGMLHSIGCMMYLKADGTSYVVHAPSQRVIQSKEQGVPAST
jgi:hypothetical protein